MEIRRDPYLNRLIDNRHDGMVKAITGMKGCGKSYLLFHQFKEYLLTNGIDEQHIIRIALDSEDNRQYRNPKVLYPYIKEQIKDSGMYYILLDEIQMLEGFESVLNGLIRMRNVDVYVTGSHARHLSKDVVTEFRGRCYEIHMYPLSFAEFMSVYPGNKREGWDEYVHYGGLPEVLNFTSPDSKTAFLKSMLEESFLPDICNRYRIRNRSVMKKLIDMLSSSVGTSADVNQLADYFSSEGKKVSCKAVSRYIDDLCDSYLTDKAVRFDVKTKRYITDSVKYYFTDMGLRNVCCHSDKTGAVENIIFNELKLRGFSIDSGLVETQCRDEKGNIVSQSQQIDFVCNRGYRRYYIQAADAVLDEEGIRKELQPLLFEGDFFKRIIITEGSLLPYYNEKGILIMNIYDFLLNENSLDF